MSTKFPEYSGMSYTQASFEAARLINSGWFRNFERLAALHEIMKREAAVC
jgi:hypothetical protein